MSLRSHPAAQRLLSLSGGHRGAKRRKAVRSCDELASDDEVNLISDSPPHPEEVTVAVSQPILDLDADRCECLDELLSREALGRVGKEHFGDPRVLGDVVILKDKLTTLTENTSDLHQGIPPVRDVVNGGELNHRVEARIWLVDGAGIAGPDLDLASSVTESPSRPANHLGIDVDSNDLARAEAIE